jgi:hypothetical protein
VLGQKEKAMKHEPSDLLKGVLARMEARLAKAAASGVSPEAVAKARTLLNPIKDRVEKK